MAVLSAPDIVTVATKRGPVRVRDTGGSGPPILLVHSFLADPDLYARLVPLLVAHGYRCVLPELPLGAHQEPLDAAADLTPTGLADHLVDILDAFAIPRVSVVGVDTGGALTQLLMAYHRDRVDRVILTACDAYEGFPPRNLKPLLWLLKRPGALNATAHLGRLRLVRWLATSRPVTHAGLDDATARRWLSPLRDPRVRRDTRKLLADMHPRYTLAAAEINRSFPRPVLVAWGDDDLIFPRRFGERLARDIPHARLVTLPDCAAFAAIDQPELLADHIHHHLNGVA